MTPSYIYSLGLLETRDLTEFQAQIVTQSETSVSRAPNSALEKTRVEPPGRGAWPIALAAIHPLPPVYAVKVCRTA